MKHSRSAISKPSSQEALHALYGYKKKWFVIILLNPASEKMFLKPLVLFKNLNTSPNKMYLVKMCLVNDPFNGIGKSQSQF